MKAEIVPPRLPQPTCIAMPTPLFKVPPMLFPFQATPIGTHENIPAVARNTPAYCTPDRPEATSMIHPTVPKAENTSMNIPRLFILSAK